MSAYFYWVILRLISNSQRRPGFQFTLWNRGGHIPEQTRWEIASVAPDVPSFVQSGKRIFWNAKSLTGGC